MEGLSEEGGAVCTAHEGALSTGTCARCGNFVCPLCLDEFSGLPEHCESCREREGGGLIPFEREDVGFFKRWWQTSVEMVLRPTRTFETTRPGSLQKSSTYVGFTGFVIGASLSLCGLCGLGLLAGSGGLSGLVPNEAELDPPVFWAAMGCAVLLYAFLIPVFLLITAFIRAGVFHIAARLLGGDGEFRAGLWSVSYLNAVSLTMLPLAVLQQIPLIGPFIGLFATLAIEAYYALQLTTVARRYYGLEEGRAAAAGWAGFVLVVALFSLCCASAVVLALAAPQ